MHGMVGRSMVKGRVGMCAGVYAATAGLYTHKIHTIRAFVYARWLRRSRPCWRHCSMAHRPVRASGGKGHYIEGKGHVRARVTTLFHGSSTCEGKWGQGSLH